MKIRIITNKLGFFGYLEDIWIFKELGVRFALKQLALLYKQTYIGVAWTILQPVALLIIFILVLQRAVDIKALGMPYAVFATLGLILWQLFSNIIRDITRSLVDNALVITKIYFPRILLPVGFTLARIVDFLISVLFLIAVMIIYGFVPSWHIVFMPIFVIWVMVPAFGVGLLFSAFAVSYRDFLYSIPVIIQVGFFLSPVFYYSKTFVPEQFYTIYSLNPVVLAIEGVRWSMLGGVFPLNNLEILLSCGIGFFSLFIGFYIFMRYEKVMADII